MNMSLWGLWMESLWSAQQFSTLCSAQQHPHLVHSAEKPGTAFPRIPCSSWLWVSSAKERLSRGSGRLRRKRNHDVHRAAVCRFVGIWQMCGGITLRITLSGATSNWMTNHSSQRPGSSSSWSSCWGQCNSSPETFALLDFQKMEISTFQGPWKSLAPCIKCLSTRNT